MTFNRKQLIEREQENRYEEQKQERLVEYKKRRITNLAELNEKEEQERVALIEKKEELQSQLTASSGLVEFRPEIKIILIILMVLGSFGFLLFGGVMFFSAFFFFWFDGKLEIMEDLGLPLLGLFIFYFAILLGFVAYSTKDNYLKFSKTGVEYYYSPVLGDDELSFWPRKGFIPYHSIRKLDITYRHYPLPSGIFLTLMFKGTTLKLGLRYKPEVLIPIALFLEEEAELTNCIMEFIVDDYLLKKRSIPSLIAFIKVTSVGILLFVIGAILKIIFFPD